MLRIIQNGYGLKIAQNRYGNRCNNGYGNKCVAVTMNGFGIISLGQDDSGDGGNYDSEYYTQQAQEAENLAQQQAAQQAEYEAEVAAQAQYEQQQRLQEQEQAYAEQAAEQAAAEAAAQAQAAQAVSVSNESAAMPASYSISATSATGIPGTTESESNAAVQAYIASSVDNAAVNAANQNTSSGVASSVGKVFDSLINTVSKVATSVLTPSKAIGTVGIPLTTSVGTTTYPASVGASGTTYQTPSGAVYVPVGSKLVYQTPQGTLSSTYTAGSKALSVTPAQIASYNSTGALPTTSGFDLSSITSSLSKYLPYLLLGGGAIFLIKMLKK